VNRVEWLATELEKRGAKIGSMSFKAPQIAVRNAISLMNDIIIKTKKNIFEVSVSPNLEYKNVLMLNYYKNGLMHTFLLEAITACALHSFGHQLAYKEGITIERLWEETEFLMRLFYKEYIIRETIQNLEQFTSLINKMKSRLVLTET